MRYVEVTTPKLLASRCGSRDASWCSAIERALGQGSGGADRRHPADGRASRKAVLNPTPQRTGIRLLVSRDISSLPRRPQRSRSATLPCSCFSVPLRAGGRPQIFPILNGRIWRPNGGLIFGRAARVGSPSRARSTRTSSTSSCMSKVLHEPHQAGK